MSEQKIEDFRRDSSGNWKLSVNAQAAAERLREMCLEAAFEGSNVPSEDAIVLYELGAQLGIVLRKFGTVDDKRNSFDEPKVGKDC